MCKKFLFLFLILGFVVSGYAGAQGSKLPLVDPAIQKSRDDTRKQILENELTNEQKLLAEAQQDLKTTMSQNESPEKIATLGDAITHHQNNIDALLQELDRKNTPKTHSKSVPVVLQAKISTPAEEIKKTTETNMWWDPFRQEAHWWDPFENQ